MARRLPSLNQLRAFEAAARHLSFKEGAAELCVTQAAVSHQVKALEEALGVKLFHRGPRAVRLTEAAREYAEVLGAAFDAIAEATARIDAGSPAPLRVSVAPFFGNRWLLPRLGKFRAAHPEIAVEASLSFELVDFAAGEVDMAVRYGLGDWPGLASRLIHKDLVGPVCAPQLVRGRALPLEPAEIAAMTLATSAGWTRDWADWFAAAGLGPGVEYTTLDFDNRAFAFDAALSGNGVWLADIRMTAADEAAGSLVRLHPLSIEREQGIWLVCPEAAAGDPRIGAFADWLRAEAEGE